MNKKLHDILHNPHKVDDKEKLTKYSIHLIVLVIIFVLPELLMSWGHNVPKIVYFHTFVYVVVFYVNYFIFIDKMLFKQNRAWAFFVVNLGLIAIYFLILCGFHEAMIPKITEDIPVERMPGRGPRPEAEPGDWRHKVGGFMMREVILIVLAVCLSVALKVSEKWVKWSVFEKQILAERRENELKNLKNQLNPHFLFNTLNNIYALIGISGQKAQLAVHELSQLLRYVLYENNTQQVPLERDMMFVKNYIELMRLRLSSLVELNVRINESEGVGKKIAPLMFISLIENAFKHGVSSRERARIDIEITVKDDKVHCHVENSYFPKDESDKSGSGVGIANLKRQLMLLYPGHHSYTAGCKDDKYVADLVIDLNAEFPAIDESKKEN